MPLSSPSGALLLARAEVLFEQLDGFFRKQEVCMREQVADVQVPGQHDLGACQVLERPADRVVRRREDHERCAVEADRFHQLGGLARLGLVEHEVLDHPDLPVDRLLAERGAQREPSHLPGHPMRVVARPRPEHVAAAFHARLPYRSVARAAGAFLAVGPGATPGDLAAGFGAGSSLARVRELAEVGLVHDRHVRLLLEDGRREVDLAVALTKRVVVGSLHRNQTFLGLGLPAGPLGLTFLVDWRTSTSAFFAPGTPPFTMSRFRSASTRTTLYAREVVRTLPIWPDMRTPLKTRAASVAPIAPGWRTFMEPCDSGPRLNLCRLIRP